MIVEAGDGLAILASTSGEAGEGNGRVAHSGRSGGTFKTAANKTSSGERGEKI